MSGAPRVRLAFRSLPPPIATLPVLERELKFTVPEERVPVVRHLLTALGRPDPVHAPARVITVYYDTPDLDGLDEKVNSDYLKTKIRVRWYERLRGGPAGDAVFVEAKYRTGATRQKVRATAHVTAAEVSHWPLESEAWVELLGPLRREGIQTPPDAAPVLRLAYVRERFIDPLGGGRLTLDTELTVQGVNSFRLRPGLAGRLRGAVVEHKGREADLPAHLGALVRAGARKASFSKYLASYTHVTGAVF